MKRLFSLLLSFITFFMTACSSPIQKTDSIYNETTKETVSVIFEETTTIKSEEATTEKFSTTTTRKPESTSKNTTNNSSIAEAANITKSVTTTKQNTKPSITEETTSSSVVPINYYPEEEIINIFNEINNYRSENNLNKLTLDPTLCKLAYIRAQEQTTLKGHGRPDGSRFNSILIENKYSYLGCGENIALINEITNYAPVEGWKNSPAHNENMLYSKWTKSGIALYVSDEGRCIIVQLFAY